MTGRIKVGPLDVYTSDLASHVMNLSAEISHEERDELKEFIEKELMSNGNSSLVEVLRWGLRTLFLLRQEAGGDDEAFNELRHQTYRKAVDKRGSVYA